MGAVERRTSDWVDLVGDLLARPLAAFPHRLISARLHQSFGCQVAWSWVDGPGRSGFEVHVPVAGFDTPEVRAAMDAAVPHHPVLRWFGATGSLAPMTVGRVPSSLVSDVATGFLQEYFVPIEAEQHLVLVHRADGPRGRGFVLARPRQDFTDEDLRVATALQRLLVLLDRQGATGAGAEATGDLTAAQLAVVRLLAQGRTAAGIAARLGISERTVHRHLQGAYGRLGAHDRVTAVLAAREAGLL